MSSELWIPCSPSAATTEQVIFYLKIDLSTKRGQRTRPWAKENSYFRVLLNRFLNNNNRQSSSEIYHLENEARLVYSEELSDNWFGSIVCPLIKNIVEISSITWKSCFPNALSPRTNNLDENYVKHHKLSHHFRQNRERLEFIENLWNYRSMSETRGNSTFLTASLFRIQIRKSWLSSLKMLRCTA